MAANNFSLYRVLTQPSRLINLGTYAMLNPRNTSFAKWALAPLVGAFGSTLVLSAVSANLTVIPLLITTAIGSAMGLGTSLKLSTSIKLAHQRETLNSMVAQLAGRNAEILEAHADLEEMHRSLSRALAEDVSEVGMAKVEHDRIRTKLHGIHERLERALAEQAQKKAELRTSASGNKAAEIGELAKLKSDIARLRSELTTGEHEKRASELALIELGNIAIVMKPGIAKVTDNRTRLGKGGHGNVFLAQPEHLEFTVAVKSINSKDEEALAKELADAAGIVHPNVIQYYTTRRIEGELYLVMEYMRDEPKTLAEHLALLSGGGRRLSRKTILELCKKIVEGVKAIHEANVVHRDLKPDNILANNKGSVKIIDFGIASDPGIDIGQQTVTGTFKGTPDYMAPESIYQPDQVRNPENREKAKASDIWALGAIMYLILTGEHPYEKQKPAEFNPGSFISYADYIAHNPFPPHKGIDQTDPLFKLTLRMSSIKFTKPFLADFDTSARPKIEEILSTINALLAKEEELEEALAPIVLVDPFTARPGMRTEGRF